MKGVVYEVVSAQKRKERRPITVDPDEEEQDLVEMHVAATEEMENKRLKLEQDHLNLDRNKDAWEMDRQKWLDELESWRLSLD
ncbi:hypothetical protein BWQ96_05142 [Gracilariopsis chorda]|uniref:Uncharacterized protein n=1 Tax=Gracilariopsis chorda TaxID=448386 RepID=A0A2V3ISK8_9FLOR|nr:hypothetical protein BWQ96_05142 [Gracilariopsis chorda]|eukprot:PXF45103.1 hypothetical protein BWQ96_05142 [Gracilariopsis chorda]